MEETNRRGQARTRVPVQAKSYVLSDTCVCAAVGAHRMHAFGVCDARACCRQAWMYLATSSRRACRGTHIAYHCTWRVRRAQ